MTMMRPNQDFDELMDRARQLPEVREYLDSFSVVVGNLVFARRMALGYTQAQLANLAGTTQARISEIEAGAESIKSGTLNKVFRALKIMNMVPEYSEEAASSHVEANFTANE